MGVFSAVAGNQLPNAKKRTTGSLPPAVPLAITPTFSLWTHTSDDSYIYQLSLVLATAIVSFTLDSWKTLCRNQSSFDLSMQMVVPTAVG